MTLQLTPPQSVSGLMDKIDNTLNDNTYYPQSDGRPMAESDIHRDEMFHIIHLLRRFYRGQQVYVTGNLLVYYEQGNARKSVAPDCFVVRGVSPYQRPIYRIWQEGKGPEVVFEISSKTTSNEDLTTKLTLYARLGVLEYFIYDPTSEYLTPPLIGYELVDGKGYVAIQPLNQDLVIDNLTFPATEGESPEYESKVLGLRLTLNEENHLVLFDITTGQRLLSDEEARIKAEEAQQQAEAERAQAEAERAQAEAERAQAEAERAQTAAENAQLREEIARLQAQSQSAERNAK